MYELYSPWARFNREGDSDPVKEAVQKAMEEALQKPEMQERIRAQAEKHLERYLEDRVEDSVSRALQYHTPTAEQIRKTVESMVKSRLEEPTSAAKLQKLVDEGVERMVVKGDYIQDWLQKSLEARLTNFLEKAISNLARRQKTREARKTGKVKK